MKVIDEHKEEIKPDEKFRDISSLQPDEQVIFIADPFRTGKRDYEFGNVVYVNTDDKKVAVNYLYGYQGMTDEIPFEYMIAVHDENGVDLNIPGIKGPSIKLTYKKENKK